MGIFRDLGRRAERFKQQVTEAADATHECESCGATFGQAREACPECGGEDVVAMG